MKVDFMIVGAMKCGTTTLARILANHPEVSFSEPKETDFFSKSPNWKESLADYESFWKGTEKIRGEGSTTYTAYPHFNLHVWDDIYAYNSNMKILYLVRNPIHRVISHYMHTFQRGYIKMGFDEAARKVQILMDVTRYYTQIAPYVERFGREHVFILTLEDLLEKRSLNLRQLSAFLGIAPDLFSNPEGVHENKTIGGRKPPLWATRHSRSSRLMRRFLPSLYSNLAHRTTPVFHTKPECSAATREMLINMLRVEICSLSELMNADLSHWLSLGSGGKPADARRELTSLTYNIKEGN
jgi:hypothetical protein